MSKRFEEFKRFWEGEIAKIENEALDSDAINTIRLKFEK